MSKVIHVIGGGTVSYISSHLAISAPAYGMTAREIFRLCQNSKLERRLHLTQMANGNLELNTNEDMEGLIEELVGDPSTKIIFFTAAMCDFSGSLPGQVPGKYQPRPSSSVKHNLSLIPKPKLINRIREKRKDIFLVGFKNTSGATRDEQYIAGLNLLKSASCNLVLANDVESRNNMVIVPEEAIYHETTNRLEALKGLVEMSLLRSHLTFTRSTVVAGDPIPWNSELVPSSLRAVVDHCISRGAYKKFRGSTAGHFAVKLDDKTFLTSRRKTDFNQLPTVGLVKVETDGPDSVIAYGSKPSVGGQSQRIVFHEHREYDCIVHFHCPIKPGSLVPTISQREYECGSHECGKNTSNGIRRFGNLSAVYLDEHGPNIVFHSSINPAEVISFIDENFDLEEKTGGHVTVAARLESKNTTEEAIQLL